VERHHVDDGIETVAKAVAIVVVALRACQDILDRAGIAERAEPSTLATFVSVSALPPAVDIAVIQTDHLTDEQLAGGLAVPQSLAGGHSQRPADVAG